MGEQAARALQHKAEISWKKTSSICREVSKHYTRRCGHHKDRTIRNCAPDRTSDTSKKFFKKGSSALSVYFLKVYFKKKKS